NLFHNIGLDAEVDGTGRGAVTGRRIDDGAYKTPTLRNVAVSGPYMHDDRFATLEEVVDFYSEGIVDSPTIDPLIVDPRGGGAQLSRAEREDLVAFLRALTDECFLTWPAFGRPGAWARRWRPGERSPGGVTAILGNARARVV